jgi:hypothetical protein
MTSVSQWCRRYGPAVVLIVAIRARYLFSPMTSDEGGYLAIARAWSHGATLYRDVWVDRPQGLLVVFAMLDRVGAGNVFGLRVFAAMVCVIAAVACGHIAATLAGQSGDIVGATARRARWVTAMIVGVLTSVPQAEGFIANAELLSCTAGAVALAMVLSGPEPREGSSRKTAPSRDANGFVFVAGLLGGVALSLKQSGFDALVVIVVALIMSSRDPVVLRTRLTRLAAGVMVPLSLMALHGAVTGWSRWWYAVVGYRIEQRSAIANARWTRFGQSFGAVAPVIAVIVVMCIVLVALQAKHGRYRSSNVILTTWVAVSMVAFAVGGNFFRHYWIIVMFPVGTMLGVVVSRIGSRAWFSVGVVAALVMPIGLTARVLTTPRDRIGPEIHGNTRLIADEEIARWFTARARPDDEIYALCASAGLYGQIDSRPPFPYLWFDDIRQVPDAVEKLTRLLASPGAPDYVARYQAPNLCDPTGQVRSAINQNYRRVAVVSGRIIYRRR